MIEFIFAITFRLSSGGMRLLSNIQATDAHSPLGSQFDEVNEWIKAVNAAKELRAKSWEQRVLKAITTLMERAGERM
jgi:hypothetical protein